MKKIEIISSVVDGKLKRNRNIVFDAISSFEGKEVLITIQRMRKHRSNNQNRYYWGVVVECWKHLLKQSQGEIYSSQEVHDFLKMNFNFREIVDETTGEILRTTKSTTENSTTEMEEYLLVCRQKAEQLFDFIIPEPNKEMELKFD